MQRVFTVHYTLDHKFFISGSDDTANIRLWKARASEQLGQRTSREETAVQYRPALVKKYQHLPEVKRISKQVTKDPQSHQEANCTSSDSEGKFGSKARQSSQA
jgi:hypothetical protein